jgi:hypothetical protein
VNDIHTARRKQLEQAVIDSTMALFEHMGVAAAFMLPLDEKAGLYVVAGPIDGIRKLVKSDDEVSP